ncbi:Uncharacterized protein APZ42_034014 [Daphnia magna]|uniref:Uncharacterized protein n=1 Tax=Daphnia magna TaxID=35525 RepID=A0A164KIZ3_9CRUS|nr:Uncharacterized protein APZ42_034014 [Daphnia magna]
MNVSTERLQSPDLSPTYRHPL